MRRKRPVRRYATGGSLFDLGTSLTSNALSGRIDTIGGYNGQFKTHTPSQLSSGLGVGAGLNIGSSVLSIGTDAINNSQIADTSALEDQLDNYGNNVASNDLDSLLSEWSSWNRVDNVTASDVRGGNAGTAALSAGKSALSGAAAGSIAGPVGTIVGGAIGGIVSGIGSLFGRRKAKKKAAQLNEQIDEANQRQLSNFTTRADTLNTLQSWLNMANSYSYGGPITTIGSKAIEYEQSRDDLYNKYIKASSTTSSSLPSYSYAEGGDLNTNPFIDSWNTARLGTGRYDHLLGNGLLESLRDNRESAKVYESPIGFADAVADGVEPSQRDSVRSGVLSNLFKVHNDNRRTYGGYDGNSNSIFVSPETPDIIGNRTVVGGYNPTSGWESSKTHEDSHAARAYPQLDLISDILGDRGTDDYLDNPSEIYSRLMLFRLYNDLDPTKVLKQKDILKLKLNSVDFDILDRYDDDTLEKLFNDIAMIDNNILGEPLLLADGGSIHIKKANRGKFTDSAKRAGMGVLEFASHVLANKEDYSPTQVKRANFARNAKEWKHAHGGALKGLLHSLSEGGNLYTNIPNQFQHGGDFTNGVTIFTEGGTHELNPFGGIPLGMDENGVPNLVEEGEVKFADYIFSDRLMADGGLLDFYNLPKKYDKKSFAKIATDLQKESSERPEDPISKRGLFDSMAKLTMALETIKAAKDVDDSNMFATGGSMARSAAKREGYDVGDGEVSYTDIPTLGLGNTSQGGFDLSFLRYAPAVGTGISSLTDAFGLTNRPDYSEADSVLNSFTPVLAAPIGDYLDYTPLDRNYYINQLNAAAGSTRRGLRDASGGNRATYQAGLLAADYNYGNALGSLARQAEEYNDQRRAQAAEFNRATNMFNSQLLLQADTYNSLGTLSARVGSAQLRAAEKARSAAARTANLSNLFEALGDIGTEEFSRNLITSNPALYYDVDRSGNVKYKKGK